MALAHGQILGGTVTTPDLDAALADYQGRLGLTLTEQGEVDADLAAAWAAPAAERARYACLQPASGRPCTLRLIEQPAVSGYRPTTTYGWNAFEISVQDVFGWPDKLTGSGFDIVGLPREIPGLPYFVAMQMVGRGGEMIYLNEVRSNTPTSDLPPARSPVDHIFICILGTPDLDIALDWYRDKLRLDLGGRYVIEYMMINRAFGLPEGTQSALAMVQSERMPIVEVDHYPDAAGVRPLGPCGLPPGNALVTLAVERLPDLEWLAPPTHRGGVMYDGRLAATTRGPAGELIELVEID